MVRGNVARGCAKCLVSLGGLDFIISKLISLFISTHPGT
jgi:hypothetical protein